MMGTNIQAWNASLVGHSDETLVNKHSGSFEIDNAYVQLVIRQSEKQKFLYVDFVIQHCLLVKSQL